MKNPPEEFLRWIKQAEHDLQTCMILFKEARFSDVCYFSEQTAQKSLKSYLYFKGERFIPIHSVKTLLEECAKYDSMFGKLLIEGGILDQYYLGPRYPDAIAPPAVPFEIFSQEQAKKALKISKQIFDMVLRLTNH
jgi:HEPN domain-containing protein